MELRQLRYVVRAVELGSMGRAADELGVVASALSQQISRLEGELSVRLLQRSSSGVRPTEAGLAFLHQAQLALRHVDSAAAVARQARLSGHVSVGLAPSTASMLALPFVAAMRQRYPEVRLRLVESLSGKLATLLDTRQLDLAVLFATDTTRRWSVLPLHDERLLVMGARGLPGWPTAQQVRLALLGELPLNLPCDRHGLRAVIDAGFARARIEPRIEPRIELQIDGLAVLMDAVRSGLGATLQPGAAVQRLPQDAVVAIEIGDADLHRRNLLASLSDNELAPQALAARVVLGDVARKLVCAGRWPGASLHET